MNIFERRSDLPFSRKSDRKKEKSEVSFRAQYNFQPTQLDEICWTNGNLMPQELADIITGPLNPSSEDEEDATVDYEHISDVVFENDFW